MSAGESQVGVKGDGSGKMPAALCLQQLSGWRVREPWPGGERGLHLLRARPPGVASGRRSGAVRAEMQVWGSVIPEAA